MRDSGPVPVTANAAGMPAATAGMPAATAGMPAASAGMPAAVRRLVDGVQLALTDRGSEPVPRRGRGSGRGPAPDGRQATGAASARVEALVALAQNGDADAFGQLYEEYVGMVFRYVFARTGDRQVSEDVTSETFLRALRRIDSFSWQGRDIGAWLLTIARNLVVDLRKSAGFRLEVATDDLAWEQTTDPAEGPEEAVLRRRRDARLLKALRRLTDDQAECLVLRFIEGLSLAECARVLGRRENAVKQLQLRAVRALRKELAAEPEGDLDRAW